MICFIEELNDNHFEVGELSLLKGKNRKVLDGLDAALEHLKEIFSTKKQEETHLNDGHPTDGDKGEG